MLCRVLCCEYIFLPFVALLLIEKKTYTLYNDCFDGLVVKTLRCDCRSPGSSPNTFSVTYSIHASLMNPYASFNQLTPNVLEHELGFASHYLRNITFKTGVSKANLITLWLLHT